MEAGALIADGLVVAAAAGRGGGVSVESAVCADGVFAGLVAFQVVAVLPAIATDVDVGRYFPVLQFYVFC